MTVERFEVLVEGGALAGTVQGEGPRVLLLHGGPGLPDYLDGLLPELDGLRVARYQQRGLAPSTAREPFDVAVQVADVVAVLDELGWESPAIVGHSWGGHLLMHVLAAEPGRVGAALVVEPLGAVGDGGGEEFGAELERRLPEDVRARAVEIDQRAMVGEASAEEALESLLLMWPAYFSAWEAAPPAPDIHIGAEAYAGTMMSIAAELPHLAGRLTGCRVPTRFVHGAMSPMPLTASTDSAAVLGAEVDVVDGVGHFVWIEAPGAVRRSLDALLADAGLG
ncbi:alpha/beta hydrolase [Nocardioides bigeumensis]|uniref:AB hydrolase-1 domain-containing protein n=1 Tax=Nocardioides bigeumensis TaxID=433657 RepID=A0ABN2YFG7_9ACTN